jgi:hypothetical protein
MLELSFYSAAVNSLSLFNVVFLLPHWLGERMSVYGRYLAAHIISTTAALAVLVGLNITQRFFVYERLTIVYAEEPEPVMITLGGV